jgi:hypothetical protein
MVGDSRFTPTITNRCDNEFMPASHIEIWTQQIQKISDELENLLLHRQIYSRYGEMVNSNRRVGSDGVAFHNWVRINYVTFVAMSIRRQMGEGPDEISLIKLIDDIRRNSNEITRDWYRTLYPDRVLFGIDLASDMANQFFDKAGGKGKSFDPGIAEKDLKELRTLGKDIKLLATRTIAHNIDKEIPRLTFDQVDQCIDKFKEITSRYLLLLTAAGNNLETVMVDDWQAIFTKPWIR